MHSSVRAFPLWGVLLSYLSVGAVQYAVSSSVPSVCSHLHLEWVGSGNSTVIVKRGDGDGATRGLLILAPLDSDNEEAAERTTPPSPTLLLTLACLSVPEPSEYQNVVAVVTSMDAAGAAGLVAQTLSPSLDLWGVIASPSRAEDGLRLVAGMYPRAKGLVFLGRLPSPSLSGNGGQTQVGASAPLPSIRHRSVYTVAFLGDEESASLPSLQLLPSNAGVSRVDNVTAADFLCHPASLASEGRRMTKTETCRGEGEERALKALIPPQQPGALPGSSDFTTMAAFLQFPEVNPEGWVFFPPALLRDLGNDRRAPELMDKKFIDAAEETAVGLLANATALYKTVTVGLQVTTRERQPNGFELKKASNEEVSFDVFAFLPTAEGERDKAEDRKEKILKGVVFLFVGAACPAEAYGGVLLQLAASGFVSIVPVTPLNNATKALPLFEKLSDPQGGPEALSNLTGFPLSAFDGLPFFPLGHSFGGMAAAEAAFRHPERVGGVVLASGGVYQNFTAREETADVPFLAVFGGRDRTTQKGSTPEGMYVDRLLPLIDESVLEVEEIENASHYQWGFYGYQQRFVPSFGISNFQFQKKGVEKFVSWASSAAVEGRWEGMGEQRGEGGEGGASDYESAEIETKREEEEHFRDTNDVLEGASLSSPPKKEEAQSGEGKQSRQRGKGRARENDREMEARQLTRYIRGMK
uniref:Alpha/beta hydrolase fold-5 domain-containing protein n=1 Tax=Chromera velia CCMP2878 TaxID=1169474 RepID=A0A0G4HSK5_9ALVE|eukprot:Cvel_8277.t1-p1 / transcript=Cvel_8277.t1 / gene=Cvel_8277 / organism=Chromera_velia_CCMP2878 / gene_product=hypothetical protein / transcript_product=hypothetical protein / location=Cvel_scaffold454:27526-30044(-) / protein_length=696 / sequence_SO=supercontig / SO=protein_coding / is_pseudo=false